MTTLPVNLDDLLHQRFVESERIEYKAGWNPDPTLRTICAFANDFANLGGGYIVVGQDCDAAGQPLFPPVGVPKARLDRIQRELLAHCQKIQPPYFPIVSVEQVDGRHLIVIWAYGGTHRPYKVPRSVTAKRADYRYYIRRYTSNVEATGEDEHELIGLAASVPFDDRYNQAASLSDLDETLIKRFLDDVGSDLASEVGSLDVESLGRKMNIVGGSTEAPYPKNVGLLFFSENPRRFFPATQIDVVFFPDGAGGDRFEEKEFVGPIGQITREAIAYIERNYLKQTVIKHPDRPEAERVWNFPLAAVEEAVVNAVYHRSYAIREPVEVRVSPEDLVVLSYPGPDRSIRMEELRAGTGVSRRYRNRRIGELLKELKMTEGRSTGIRKILRAMEHNGSPLPEFDTDEERSYFLVRLPVHRRTLQELSPERVTPQVPPQVTPQVLRLLRACDGERLREDLQQQLELTDRKHFRAHYLRPALAAGVIEMTIPDKPRSSKQRYRLTSLGQAMVERS